jgi:dTDP-4-dehydrorhamnose reductase
MKILLLGANGNLGSQLQEAASKNQILITWESADINLDKLDELESRICDLNPDCLINAMAYNAVDNCESNDDEYALAKKLKYQFTLSASKDFLKIKFTICPLFFRLCFWPMCSN